MLGFVDNSYKVESGSNKTDLVKDMEKYLEAKEVWPQS
jgi:hypothetical protein